MSYSDEQINNQRIDIFDNIQDWADISEVKSLCRLLSIIPMMEQCVLDALIDRLKQQHIFRQGIKRRLNQVEGLVNSALDDVYKSLGINNKGAANEDGITAFDSAVFFGLDMVDKIAASCLEYMTRIEKLTNISEDLTPEDHCNYVLDNATLLYRLKEGDTFFFIDQSAAVEYTYLGTTIKKTDVICKFTKRSTGDVFDTDNPYRPVILTNFFSEETLKSLDAHFKRQLGVINRINNNPSETSSSK